MRLYSIWKFIFFSILASTFAFSSDAAFAQAPLPDGGKKAEGKTFSDFALQEGGGRRIYSLRLRRPGADYVRVAFEGIAAGADDKFIVIIADSNDQQKTRYTAEQFSKKPTLTTPVIWGDTVNVRVISKGEPEGLNFAIPHLQFGQRGGVPASPVGVDQRESILQYDNNNPIRSNGRPVARLIFSIDGAPYTCTGFLISEDELITNEHCVNSQAACETAVAIFGYDAVNVGKQYPCITVSPDRVNVSLDYAVLRLDGRPGDEWGMLEPVSRSPSAEDELYIIQHPGGQPKQVSRTDCKVIKPKVAGIDGETDLSHACDTLGGSSGSPVFDLSTHEVIALHHLGYFKGSIWENQNRAVLMSEILKDLNGAQ